MRAMHELEEQHADYSELATGRMRADWSGTTGFSVQLLATHDHQQDAAVLGVRGEVDLGTAPALREALQPVIEHQTGPVVVDLSDVTFVDSTGVHVLVETLERLRLENRRLAIACREGGQVHRVLALVGLLAALTVYDPRESALIGRGEVLR
jgi:anti-sigma B factor antagonist